MDDINLYTLLLENGTSNTSVQRDTEFTDVILVVIVPSGVATTTGIN